MSFQDNETSSSNGNPIELYEFVGTYNSYYYTSYGQNIISGGNLYISVPIERNKFKVGTQEQTDNSLQVTLPFNNEMIKVYAFQNAPPELVLILRRAHEQDYEDTAIFWNGRVTSFSVAGNIASLKVPSLFSYIIQGNTPSPRYQAPCNHILYDSLCGVDSTLHQHVATITENNGTSIRVSSLPWVDGDASAGSMIAASGEQRMIMSNSSDILTISYAFSSLSIGDTVTIRKGCDHSFNGDCKNKFSNGSRFGGFPIVPTENPFTKSLL